MTTEAMIRGLNAVAEKHKNDFVPTFQTNISAMCRDIIPKLKQLSEYEKIGTVDECREAVEKRKAKQPQKVKESRIRYTDGYICPSCGGGFTGTGIAKYCYHCGQAIDWS